MENQFYKEDFEKFLKNNADQYRMYPSEKVWKGVYSALHTRRRWYGITAIAVLLISSTLIGVLISVNRNAKMPVAEVQNNSSFNTQNKKVTASFNNNTSVKKEPQSKPSVINQKDKASFPIYTKNDESPVLRKQDAVIMNQEVPAETPTTTEEKNIPAKSNDESLPVTKKDDLVVIPKENRDNTLSKEELTKATMALASKNAPEIKSLRRSNRLTAQFFITPAISYRKLSENKSYLAGNSNIPFTYTQFMDVNNLVKHKPALGLEFGIEGRYQIKNFIAATAGFQFNINRYDIKAFYHPTEITTIALNSRTIRPDSLFALSNYRNFGVYSPNWIENFYFQVSLPVGVEFILLKNKKFEWGVSGNVQPTYTIGDKAYLITTDYKNYVKVPNLMRRWNLNTGVGAFVSTATGNIKWQVGPQLRYQHFSSFEDIYPVKENLFNVGFKIGASINKK